MESCQLNEFILNGIFIHTNDQFPARSIYNEKDTEDW